MLNIMFYVYKCLHVCNVEHAFLDCIENIMYRRRGSVRTTVDVCATSLILSYSHTDINEKAISA